jgi:hypothetical protein
MEHDEDIRDIRGFGISKWIAEEEFMSLNLAIHHASREVN